MPAPGRLELLVAWNRHNCGRTPLEGIEALAVPARHVRVRQFFVREDPVD